MKKKLVSILMCTVMAASMIGGCGSGGQEGPAEAPAETEAPSETGAAAEEETPAAGGETAAEVSELNPEDDFDGGGKVIRVGLSWEELQSSINQAWQDYFMTYSEEYGKAHNCSFDWIVTVADGDPAKEMSNIQDLINQEVDCIVAWANNGDTIGESIKAAQAAGIPFVTFDHESTNVKPDAHVGEDSYTQAYTTATEMVRILEANGVTDAKAVVMQGTLTDSNAIARGEAWKKVEEETGAWETVEWVPTDWEAEKFKSGLANVLAAHPEINLIYLESDFAFNSVAAALEETDRLYPIGDEKHVYIAGDDVQPQGYQGQLDGYIDCGTTYDAWNQAVAVVEVVAKLSCGLKVPQVNYIQGRLATPDTVESLENLWSRDYND